MAVKIRLRRMGRKKRPFYRVIVADSRSPRDGRFIDEIGYYDPLQDPDLRGREAHAVRFPHRVIHVLDELRRAARHLLHRLRLLPKDRIACLPDLSQRHKGLPFSPEIPEDGNAFGEAPPELPFRLRFYGQKYIIGTMF